MPITNRYLQPIIKDFLKEKMVFLGGPRQVGKTTLCLSFLSQSHRTNPDYLNWDDLDSKSKLRKGQLPNSKLIVIDEVHKFKAWRNLIKGFYDKRHDDQQFLITGSARLDHYRRGGDSLLGRYRYLRLHPFSWSELQTNKSNIQLADLLKFGGFPEPLFAKSEKKLKLWNRERLHRLIHDDIRDLESIREFNLLETLAEALPDRVGSILSIKSLAEDLQVSPHTIKNWIEILEKVYFCYRTLPFGSSKIRAVKKETKLYLWDWSSITEIGAKFENMVGSHLLKYCHFLEDTEGDNMELRYIRDTDGREVDFVVIKNKKPLFAVECKVGDSQLSKNITYFKQRTNIPKFYQVHLGTQDYIAEKNCRVLPFTVLCDELNLV